MPRSARSWRRAHAERRHRSPPQQHIERAGAAILRLRRGRRRGRGARLGASFSQRGTARAQHAAAPCSAALAGDHQHAAPPGLCARAMKRVERAMRLGLGHAVQIEPRLDRRAAAPQPLGAAAVDAGVRSVRQLRRAAARRGWRGAARGASCGRRRGGSAQLTGSARMRRRRRRRSGAPRRASPRATAPRSSAPRVKRRRHPRRARYAAAAARARPVRCAARYRRCATGR